MLSLDSLALASIAGYVLLAAVTLLSARKHDWRDPLWRSSMLLAVAGNLLAYAAASPWVFLAGWCLSVTPLWLDRESYGHGVRVIHSLSIGALTAAFLHPHPAFAFGLLVFAAFLRKGIFPFHFWVPGAFERGSIPYLGLLFNGHLGAYLMLRFAVPRYPEIASQALSILGMLAILTSLYAAVLAIAARQPRRILALLCISQAAFILAGIENRNPEGITGALLQWWVVAFATTSLLLVYRALEARTTEAAMPQGMQGMLGLGYHAPRLAVFFAVSALALIGLPGTLGFIAEDLLFHGSLESHPLLGIGLPLATAINAITAIRLMAVLFMGRRGLHTPPVPDATMRERLAFSLLVVLLVAGGIAPSLPIEVRGHSAAWIAGLLTSR